MARMGAMAMCVVLVLVVVAGSAADMPVCNPAKVISVCDKAIRDGTAPSASCCSKFREQQECLCKYLYQPGFSNYFNTPNSRKTIKSCGIPLPFSCVVA
jgi:hypothetical protein